MTSCRYRIACLLAGLLLGAAAGEAYAARVLYLAPYGSDRNDGLTPQSPLATLRRAHQLVDLSAHGDHTIYVRGGTYRGQSVGWRKHDSQHSITIEAYGGERPIFDGIHNGQMQPYFIYAGDGRNRCSNLTIRGLTIRHYLNWAVSLGDSSGGQATWSGCNVIEDNVFERNGDLFLPPPYQCNETQRGYGAIMLHNTGHNIVRRNVIANSENCPGAEGYMHAVYLTHGSSDNHIFENYVWMTSGDTFRVRDASNHNHFYDNYVDRSGAYGFIAGWRNVASGERPSSNNVIENNTVTLPYPAFDSIDLICRDEREVCDESTFIDRGQHHFDGGRAAFGSGK